MLKIELKIASLNIQGGLSSKCKNIDFINLVQYFDLIDSRFKIQIVY